MKIAEVVGADPLKSQLDRVKKSQQALKVRKAAVKAQQAQQRLRTVRSQASK